MELLNGKRWNEPEFYQKPPYEATARKSRAGRLWQQPRFGKWKEKVVEREFGRSIIGKRTWNGHINHFGRIRVERQPVVKKNSVPSGITAWFAAATTTEAGGLGWPQALETEARKSWTNSAYL